MPYNHTWYIQNHILKVELSGEITLEEMSDSLEVTAQFLQDSSAEHVHFILDWSQLKRFPTNIREIRRALQVNQQMLGKIGAVLVYGVANESMKFLANLAFQVFHMRIQMVSDFEAALDALRHQDGKLASIIDKQRRTDVTWYLPGHILYCYDLIVPEDMMKRNQKAYDMIEAEGKPPYVHMLIDFSSTDIEEYSVNVRNIVQRSKHSPEFEEARENLIQHPLFGWVVVFNIENPSLNLGGKLNAMRTNYKRKDVPSLIDALNFLKQVDPNITNLLPKKK